MADVDVQRFEAELTPQLGAAQRAIRLLMGFIAARAVYAAAKLGLADAIGSAGASAEDLAARLGADASGLERLLSALSGLGVVAQEENGRYSLTPIGASLRKDVPDSIRDYAIYVHEFLYDLFEGLVPGVMNGKPVVAEKLGAPLFAYLQQHAEIAALFHAGLANRGRIEAPAILEAVSFAGCRKIADLGGGNGAFLSAILAAYPAASGALLERTAALYADRRRLFRRGSRRLRRLYPEARSLRSHHRGSRPRVAALSRRHGAEWPSGDRRGACRGAERGQPAAFDGSDLSPRNHGTDARAGGLCDVVARVGLAARSMRCDARGCQRARSLARLTIGADWNVPRFRDNAVSALFRGDLHRAAQARR